MDRIPAILIFAAAVALTQSAAQSLPSPQNGAEQNTAVSVRVARSTVTGVAHEKSRTAVVAESAPVITIHGLCDSQAERNSAKANCATVLSRREFEGFVGALSATTTRGIEPPFYRAVAESYTALEVNSKAGEKAGVDKDPRFGALLEATRLRALGGMYRAQEYTRATQVPAEEIEADYEKNRDSYEEVDLDRFLVPRNNPANFSDEAFREKAKRLADEMRARAVKGEDLAKLEKEALAALGDTKPATIAVGVRRGQLEDKADKLVFALGQNEVTPVLEDRGLLWMFFRRTDRQVLSLDTIRSEIRGKLFLAKLDMIDKSLQDAVKVNYNEAYFGPSPEAAKAKGEPASSPSQSVVKLENQSAATTGPAPHDAVITIHGLCGEKQDPASSCARVVTREEFESALMIARLTPSKTGPASPRSVAKEYVDTLIYGAAGERAGLDKDPRFAEIMNMSRKRALTDMYRVKLEEEAHRLPAEEIEAYYKNNLAGFDEVKLSHVSVVKQNPKDARDANFQKKARLLVSELRQRADAGEDMEKLQQEAYEKLGLKNPPTSQLQPLRRGALDQQVEQEIYAMKAGETTTIKDIPSVYIFYKLENRRTVPLGEAQPEISYLLYRQKLAELTKAKSESLRAEYNERYFSSLIASQSLSASTPTLASQKAPSSR
jgi:hypothetical protein